MLSLKAELSVLWSWFSLNLVRKVKLWSRPGNAQSFEKPAVNPALLLILSLSVLIPKCPMLFFYLLLSLRSGGIGQGPDLFFFFFFKFSHLRSTRKTKVAIQRLTCLWISWQSTSNITTTLKLCIFHVNFQAGGRQIIQMSLCCNIYIMKRMISFSSE